MDNGVIFIIKGKDIKKFGDYDIAYEYVSSNFTYVIYFLRKQEMEENEYITPCLNTFLVPQIAQAIYTFVQEKKQIIINKCEFKETDKMEEICSKILGILK